MVVCYQTGWLVGWLVVTKLVGWLFVCLLPNWLVGWLVGWLLPNWLVGCGLVGWSVGCCSAPQLNTLRVTQYVHPHPYIYKYRYSPYSERIVWSTVFNDPTIHIGSHNPSSEEFISLPGE